MRRWLAALTLSSLVPLAACGGGGDTSSSSTGTGGNGTTGTTGTGGNDTTTTSSSTTTTAGTGGNGTGGTGGNGGAGTTTTGTGGNGGATTTTGTGGDSTTTGTTTGTGGSGGGGGPPAPQAPPSPFIVVDQFGYLPTSEKIAVLRNPITGFDAADAFTPGASYALVDAATNTQVLVAAPKPWNNGAQDPSSGDAAWWFDFSSVNKPGDYYVLDLDNKVRSHVFRVADDVYRDVLKQAVRTFFYQRAGFEKKAQYAGAGWADGASHVGPLQDKNARRFNAVNDPSTERDLHGGWYDAGDYNKYTSWSARYVIALLRAHAENPAAFGDDYNIPESGNGLPDIIDEAKWGMDFLVRMQNPDGSVLSIVGLDGASPPSAAAGPSRYGLASTAATLATAAAFAYGSKVFRGFNDAALTAYADDLQARAEKAWSWAAANPAVTFYNNQGAAAGLGAGQQETDDYGRLTRKIEAAIYLYEVTQKAAYKTFVDANYDKVHLIQWSYAYPFEADEQQALLYYTKVPGATAAVVNAIKSTYVGAIQGADNLQAITDEKDPYRAWLKDYTWGSNRTKSEQGGMYHDVVNYALSPALSDKAARAAERYIHYLHGVNPLSLVYLTNMYDHGAEQSANEFYHSWFADKSPAWDRVGVSTWGPPPGFLTGGPNPSYDIDGCCPNGCGSPQNNALCNSEPVSPPKGQPAQKSYKDFNTSWPLDSWSVTENSNGYQVAYIRLLSKFVK